MNIKQMLKDMAFVRIGIVSSAACFIFLMVPGVPKLISMNNQIGWATLFLLAVNILCVGGVLAEWYRKKPFKVVTFFHFLGIFGMLLWLTTLYFAQPSAEKAEFTYWQDLQLRIVVGYWFLVFPASCLARLSIENILD